MPLSIFSSDSLRPLDIPMSRCMRPCNMATWVNKTYKSWSNFTHSPRCLTLSIPVKLLPTVGMPEEPTRACVVTVRPWSGYAQSLGTGIV